MTDMFGNWLNGVDIASKEQFRTDICALIWAIWNCRNDIVFTKKYECEFLTDYLYGYILDPRVVLSFARDPAGAYGF
jgi:hypothetical protein